ncbi:MAG: outer membrane beta-barrel protein [Calditrichaeota bacterium]|nr:outer membrane beta-barrel protein [Calditrichota bacterium]
MKTSHLVSGMLVLLLCASGVAKAQSGQGEIGVTLFGGFFKATANQVELDLGQINGEDQQLTAKHEGAPLFGLRVNGWLNSNVGLETAASFTQSGFKGEAFGEEGTIRASLFYSSLKIMLSTGGPVRLNIGGGFGLVTSSYNDPSLDGNTHMTGVLSAGLNLPLAPNIAINLGFEDHIHSVFWDLGNGVETPELTQHDLLFSAGLCLFRSN